MTNPLVETVFWGEKGSSMSSKQFISPSPKGETVRVRFHSTVIYKAVALVMKPLWNSVNADLKVIR